MDSLRGHISHSAVVFQYQPTYILDGPDVVYVAKAEGTHRFYVPTTIGRRNPAYCTGVGKAILAHLPEADLEVVSRAE